MQYTEPVESLDPKTNDCARGLKSLQEELEAVSYYHQRVAATSDPTIREILAHNRDEEIEHAAMLLEWLRRNMDGWDEALRTYLFTSESIVAIEGNAASEGGDGALGIGSLRV
jgi:ferritin-like protein